MRYKKDLKLCALVVDGGKKPQEISSENTLIIVGNEAARQFPHEWLAECDDKMTISMPGNAESLNAAVAGSIGLYLTFVK